MAQQCVESAAATDTRSFHMKAECTGRWNRAGDDRHAPDTYRHRHNMTEVDTTAGTCSLYILEAIRLSRDERKSPQLASVSLHEHYVGDTSLHKGVKGL